MKISDLKIGTRLYACFGAIVLLLVALVSIAYINLQRAGAANDINIHTYEVIGEVDSMLESVTNIETGQRGFSLTGNNASLEPYNTGKTKFKEHWDKAKSLTSDNPQQQERLQSLLDPRAKEADALQTQTQGTLTIGGTIAAVLALMLAVWLPRNITVPLREYSHREPRIVSRHLNVRHFSEGESK